MYIDLHTAEGLARQCIFIGMCAIWFLHCIVNHGMCIVASVEQLLTSAAPRSISPQPQPQYTP